MKFIKIYFFFLFFISLSIVISCNKASSEDIKWRSFDEGMSIGKKNSKKVFIHFWTGWCGYCTKMANETFKDPAVVSFLNENFVAVRVNANKEKDLAAKYNVRGLPDNWFISKEGERIGHLPGYIPSDKMYLILKYIYSDSYKQTDFNQFSLTKE